MGAAAKRRRPRQRGHLRQRGSSWVVTYRVDGRQVWRSFPDREQAELWLAERRLELARNEARAPARVTFSVAARAWVDHGRDRNLSPKTIRDRESVLSRWLEPAFGPRRLEDVTAASITKWRREQMRTLVEFPGGETRPAMSLRNAEKITALLYSIFEFARVEYALPSNPVARVERLRVRYDPASFDYYEPEEVHALARAASSDQDRAIYLVAAFAGLRMGECLALRWRDVDFAQQTIRVERSLTDERKMKAPKSGRSRSVPLASTLVGPLDRLSQRDTFTGPDELVFVGGQGEPLDGSALRRRYKAAQKRARLRPIRFHDLRHSFGTVAANAARSGHELQEWMGHADYRTTQRYLHYRSRGDEAARLDAAFATGSELQADLQADCKQTASTGVPQPAAS